MKSVFKVLGVSFLVILIAAIALPYVFQKQIVQLVKETANEELNAKVEFGDFNLSLIRDFPDFNFAITDLSVANEGIFEGDTLFAAKKVAFGIDFMSVLGGQNYKVNSIFLQDPYIHLQVLKDSSVNYDIAKPSTDTTVVVEDTVESAPVSLTINNLNINNAHIIYEDALSGTFADVNDLSFDLDGDLSAGHVLIETLTRIEELTVSLGGVKYLNKAKLTFDADVDADLDAMHFEFRENELSLNALLLGFDGFVDASSEGDIGMDVNFHVNKTSFKTILSLVPGVFTKDFEDVETTGIVGLSGFAKGTYSETLIPVFGIDLTVDNASFHYPDLPESVHDIAIDLHVKNSKGLMDATLVDLNKFHAEIADNPIDAMMHVATPISDPYVNANVKMNLDLESLNDVIPLEKGDEINGIIDADVSMAGNLSMLENEEYEKFEAEGQCAIADMHYVSKAFSYPVNVKSLKLNFTPKFVELVEYDSKIGKSDMQMNGRIDNFLQYVLKDSLLKGTFNFTSAYLDVNELMASDTVEVVETAATSDTAETEMSPVEVPSNLDVVLNSTIGKVVYGDYLLTDLSGAIMIKDSKLSMNKLALKMPDLEGSLVMSGVYNTQNIKKPRADFDLDMKGFDIQKSFKTFNSVEKLAPIGKYTTGKFSTLLKFSTELDDKMEPVYNTLNGGGALITKDVIVKGFKPLEKAATLLKQDKYKKLIVGDANLTYSFVDGRMVIKETPMNFGTTKALVSGSTGIDQTIEYLWKLQIPREELGGQANALAGSLLDQINSKAGTSLSMGDMVKVNLLFGGTVTKPTVKTKFLGADGESTMKEAVKDQAKEAVAEVKEVGKEMAREEADKVLESAKVQADKIKAEAKKVSDKARSEGYALVDKTVADAKNPFAKKAAELAAPTAKKKVDKKADDILKAANDKADAILAKAREKADAKLK